ncbi:hypothetical protein [Sporosarcina sp. PTS2304]|nr:hypothetical protein [Sporosarcina sp. PTS2304]
MFKLYENIGHGFPLIASTFALIEHAFPLIASTFALIEHGFRS